jgi:hypothetical protein
LAPVCQSDHTLKNRIHSLWGGMSKPELWGLIVLVAGIVVGLVSGGPAGLVLAAVCLVVGLVLFVASEAMGTKHSGVNPNTASTEQKASVLVLVKEVHARPQRGNKFQEISDPHQADLEFEVFANCWMINVTDEPLGIRELQFSLRIAEGSATVLQRIRGDLANWRLGRLKDELDSWGVRYLQAAHEQISELDSTATLEAGVAREGWLHYHVQNVTPAEIENGAFELSARDSRGGRTPVLTKVRIKSQGESGPFTREAAVPQPVPATRLKPSLLHPVPPLLVGELFLADSCSARRFFDLAIFTSQLTSGVLSISSRVLLGSSFKCCAASDLDSEGV